MKKQQRDKNCSILSSILVCLPFNILGKLTLLIGMGLIIPSTMHSLQCLLGLVITNMEGLVVLLEVQIGILQVQTRVEEGITKLAGPKLEATVVGHILHKDGDHRMVGVACLLPVKGEPLVVMELVLQITPKVVNLEVQLVVEVQTHWVVTETSNMVGSNDR